MMPIISITPALLLYNGEIMRHKRFNFSQLLSLHLALLLLSLFSFSPSINAREVVDMDGTVVIVPEQIQRVVTLGATPVINSLVFAVGGGNLIVNGLPTFALHPRWRHQYDFAPQLKTLPMIQNPDRSVKPEAILEMQPDVVLTMDRFSINVLKKLGIPAIYLSWRHPEDVKKAIAVLGTLFNTQPQALAYQQRFDEIIVYVNKTISQSTSPQPRVLYLNPKTLSQPHLVAEWWIRAAGGKSVTDNNRSLETYRFSLEQLLSWNPEVIIVSNAENVRLLQQDPRFRNLSAVQNQRIFAAPVVAHTWGNRTAEQPLTVLWAASCFYPELFSVREVEKIIYDFYNDIFATSFSTEQIQEFLKTTN